MVTEAQRRAIKRWNENNKKRRNYLTIRSNARRFVRMYATEEDFEELKRIWGQKNEVD